MKELFFNTGVKYGEYRVELFENEVVRGGVIQNVFYVEKIPEGAVFAYIVPEESVEKLKLKEPGTHFEKIVKGYGIGRFAAFKFV